MRLALLVLAFSIGGCTAYYDGRARAVVWHPPAGARMVTWGCAHGSHPFGGYSYASAIRVDLDGGRWAWWGSNGPKRGHEGPLPVPPDVLAELRRLVAEVSAQPAQCPADLPVLDGEICDMDVMNEGAAHALVSIQRNTQDRHDAVDVLIEKLIALRSRGLDL